jgi:2-polyprenyl-3-methyl-5-hydroxy-6-metoxy-1,4-benzoquinol methylase
MIHCSVCNSKEAKLLIHWKQYTINKCQVCHCLFSEPIPRAEELTAFYQGFLFKKPGDEDIERLKNLKSKELLKYFTPNENGTQKKFLDFGGGTGIAFAAASEQGFDVYYSEIDQEAINFVREKFNLQDQQFIRSLEEGNLKFDCILSDNVIEHVQDPNAFVQMLYNQLEADGLLVIKTPHASNTSIYFYPFISIMKYFRNARRYNSLLNALKVLRYRIWHCDPPRHLYSFSQKSLQMIGEKICGRNDKVEITFYDIPLFEYSVTRSFFSKDKRMSGIKSILVRILVLPILPIEFLSKFLQYVLQKLGLLSAGGITLMIRKGKN